MGSLPRLCVLGLAASLGLSACASSGSGGAASGSASAGDTLTIYSQWQKGQPGQKLMQSVADDFQKETGIKVTIRWKGNEAAASLIPAMNRDNPPADAVETSSAHVLKLLVPTGGILELSDFYNQKAFKSAKTIAEVVGKGGKMGASVVDASGTVTNKVIMVPYWRYDNAVWFYNGKSLPQLKGNEPTTWDQMLTVLAQQKAKGRYPIALDGSVTNYNGHFFSNFAWSIGGNDAMIRAFKDKSGVEWKKPEYLQSAKLVSDIVQKGYFLPSYDASKFPAEENKWANNEADFSLNGSWLPGEVGKVAAPGFDYQTFLFPAVSGHPAPGIDGAGASGVAIVRTSKHIDAAKQFIGFLLQSKYQQRVATEMGMIPVGANVPVPPALVPIKEALDAGTNMIPLSPEGYDDWKNKVFLPEDDKLIFGKISPDQFITALQSDTVAYWKAK